MRNKKATGDDDVPGDVLKLFGERGLKIMTKLINTIYEIGEWPKDFTEVTMFALKKKPQATKCSDHRAISLIAHTAKIVAKILRRRIEKKIKDVFGEDQFGFRRGKGTRNAIGMLRIISERTLETDEELSVCFIDWQKAFDRVNWTKLMQVLKEIGIDWRERRLISNLYMAQSVKVRLNRGETRSVKTGRGFRQGCCLSPILFNL
jgi:retron-type reverse transcriptase